MNEYKTIRFHGVMREKFGKEYRLCVSSTKEAMRLLAVQLEGFEQFMLNAHKKGMRFAVFQDKHNIAEHELEMSTGADLIRIMPIIKGAGGDGGVLNTVLGAVLVVVGVVMMYFPATAPFASSVIGAGIGLMVGGIAQMLMPKVNTEDSNNDGNKTNYGFGGAVTTVAQGNPVPVLYGQRMVGGFVINAGQYPEDML